MEEPNPEPTFTRVDYHAVNEISYLNDFIALDVSHFDYLESLNTTSNKTEKKQQTKFDNIATQLYKKIVKQGYVQRPSTVSKKSKKGDADFNFYNINDDFIDDDEIIEKKDIFSQYKDYRCISISSLEELYASEDYRTRAQEVVAQTLKRKAPDQFNPDNVEELEKFDEVKKKIKNNIKEFILKKMSPLKRTSELEAGTNCDPIKIQDTLKPTLPHIQQE